LTSVATKTTKMLIFQYYSDLHLEHRHLSQVPKIFPANRPFMDNDNQYVCILAGDIGCPFQQSYWQLLSQVSHAFDYVVVVLGNHEYYGQKIGRTQEHISTTIKALNLANVHVMDKGGLQIGDTIILGTTLWSNIPQNVQEEVRARMNDYRLISDFTVELQNKMHNDDVCWLREKLAFIKSLNRGEKIVVVTHHAPLFKGTSHPKFDSSVSTYAFGTDLQDLIDMCDVWVYGHTHYNAKTTHLKLRTNQLGYGQQIEGFDENAQFCL
jgi:predicted phosphodiesterase